MTTTDIAPEDVHYIRLDGKIWRAARTLNLDDDLIAINYEPTDLPLDTPVIDSNEVAAGPTGDQEDA